MTDEVESAASGWIVFDRIEIDLVGRRLFVADAQVALEPKAFAVLMLFAQHPGRAFARDEILDAVWGHRHVTPGVLNRVITLLRQALGEGAQHAQYIVTLHGIGYRFDAATHWRAQRMIEETPGAVAPTAAEADVEIVAPQGELPPPATPLAAPSRVPRVARYAALTMLVLLLVLAVWTWWPGVVPAPVGAQSASPESVAVLPLKNATGDANQQYFVDGIAENLIATLSQYDRLKVIGRGSSFRFRDSKLTPEQIGANLGVTHLFEGSVQRDGEQLRIGIELIRAADGSTVWSQNFDKPFKDLFALQDEISLAVAAALQVKLLNAKPGAVATGRPVSGNLDAYNAYLRGTYYFGAAKGRMAMESFAQATQIDPSYAQAWAWLGLVRTVMTQGGALTGAAAHASYIQAREEIETALRLQPNFGQGHAIYANWLRTANRDWNASLAEFQIALASVPETDPSHGAYSLLLAALGRVKEAAVERRKYIAGDPLNGFGHYYLADLLIALGQLDNAETSLQEGEKIDRQQIDWASADRVEIAVARGDADAALAAAKRISSGRWREHAIAYALQIGSDRKAADTALQKQVESVGNDHAYFYPMARLYALRGDADKTFEWLQRDAQRDVLAAQEVLYTPVMLRFRDDPRFAEYCKQVGLPPPSASDALGIDRIWKMAAAKN